MLSKPVLRPWQPRRRQLALEPRQLFDGAAAATPHDDPAPTKTFEHPEAVGPASPDAANATRPVGDDGSRSTDPPAATRRQLVVVDPAVSHWETLLKGISPDVDVLVLDGSRDALAQIHAALDRIGQVSALHLLSHGEPGAIRLGNQVLDTATLAGFGAELDAIGQDLEPGGDVLVYGCSVAAGAQGEAFLHALAAATRADVAASDNATGAAALGGDWVLERQTGSIAATPPLTAAGIAGFDALLAAAPTITDSVSTVRTTREDTPQAISGITIDDPDGNPQTVTLNVTQGTLALASLGGLSGVTGNGTGTVTFTGSLAAVNAALNGITYTPGANYDGPDTLGMATNDGTQTTTHNAALGVTPVNDAPTIAPSVLAVNEGGSARFAATNFGIADIDNIDAQIIVKVASTPTHGIIRIGDPVNGPRLVTGSTISKDQLGNLFYVHDASQVTTPAGRTDSFSVTVDDGAGGTIAATPIPIAITSINQAPTVRGAATIFESQTGVAITGITIADPDQNAATPFDVAITSLPSVGTLRFDGIALTAADVGGAGFAITQAAIAAGRLTYDHDGSEGPPATSFTITARDDGGGTTPQVRQTTTGTVNLTITPNNDDPVMASNTGLTLDGSTGATAVVHGAGPGSQLLVTDPDSPAANLAFVVRSLPSTPGLEVRLNNHSLGVGATFTQADLDAGRVTIVYQGTDPAPITDTGFQFAVRDSAITEFVPGLFPTPREGGIHTTPTGTTLQTFTFPITVDATAPRGVVAPPAGAVPPNSGPNLGGPGAQDVGITPADLAEGGSVVIGGSGAVAGPRLVVPDPDNSPDQLVYRLEQVPTGGSIRLNGAALGLFGTFTQADLDAGRVTFAHAGGEDFLDGFRFTVSDGENISALGTFGIDVAPINDAPTLTAAGTAVLSEGGVFAFNAGSGVTITPADVDGSGDKTTGFATPNTLTMRLVTAPAHGTIFVDANGNNAIDAGEALVAGGEVARAALVAGQVKYRHDGSENFIDTVTFAANDNTGQPNNLSAVATIPIEIASLNDAPSLAENVPLTLGEGSAATIGGAGAAGARLVYTDPDNTSVQRQFRITTATANGSLTLNGRILGVGSSFTQAQLDAGLLRYTHSGNEAAADTFAFIVSDGDRSVAGSYDIAILRANDAPTLTVPTAAQVFDTATPLVFGTATGNAITFADPDLSDGIQAGETDVVRLTLDLQKDTGAGFATYGASTLTLASTAGLTPITGTSGATGGVLVFEGTQAAVRAALEGLTVQVPADEDAGLHLVVTLDDRNNGGPDPSPLPPGYSTTVTRTIVVDASNVNDAPTIAAPAAVAAVEDVTFAFVGGNAITIADPDAFDSVSNRVTLSVTNGVLDVASLGGVTVVAGANASATVTLEGSLVGLNAALASLSYRAAANFNGAATLTILADDRGNTGLNAGLPDPKTATHSVDIAVAARNDQPTLTVPGPQVIAAGTTVTIPAGSIRIGDAVDIAFGAADSFTVTVRATAALGTFSVTPAGSAVIGGQNTGVLTISGTAAAIHGVLDTLVFTASNANADALETVQVTVDDANNGAEGNGSVGQPATRVATFTVAISNSNEAPVLTAPGAVAVNEDGTLAFTGGNAIVVADPDDFGAPLEVTLSLGPAPRGTFTLGTTTGLALQSGAFANSGAVVFRGSEAAINTALASLVFTPTPNTNLIGTTQPLTVTIDDRGNTGVGGPKTDTRTIAITINPVNDAPLASGAATLPPVAEDSAAPPGATVATLASALYSDATDTVPGGSTGTPFAGIGIVANAATTAQGRWQFSLNGGTTWINVPIAGLANASALVLPTTASLRFLPAANFNGVPGSLSIRLSDGTAFVPSTSATTLRNIAAGVGGTGGWSAATVAVGTTITAVNDAPTRSAATATLAAINEDATPGGASVTSLFNVRFRDTTDAITTAVSGGSVANTLAGVAITGNTADPVTEGRWQFSTNGGTTWTDVGTVSSSDALVLAGTTLVRFNPVANYNGSPPGLDARLVDNSGGAVTTGNRLDVSNDTTLSGGTTAVANSANVVTLGTQVRPVNDAPVLTDTALALNPIAEDPGPPVGAVGTLVSALTGGIGDVDAGAVRGVAITAANTASGTWFFSINNGATWQALGTPTATAARLLSDDGNTRLYFLPSANFNGTVANALTIRAWDRTTGTNGATASTTANGGTTAFSTATDVVAITVTPVQDPPVARNDSATTAEDTPLVLPVATVLANDTDVDGDTLTVSSVSPTSLSGGTVALDTVTGRITYTPPLNFNGTDTFTYTISDGNGNTSTATVTVNVTAVNDSPAGSDNTITLAEDTSRAFTPGDFNFSDPDPGDHLTAVRIDSLPAAGNLTFRGSPVLAGQVIAFADIGDLVFRPGPNDNGVNYASFGFSVRDNTGLFAASPSTLTLNVTPVNDAPIALGETGNTPEDTPLTFTTAALLANDTDVDGDTLTITAVSPASANGGTVSLVAGKVIYTPAANFNGTDTFTYTVDDGHGGTASATVSVTVTPVNDAPVSANATRTIDEDTVYRFTGAEFAFADPDAGDALVAVRIDSLPARGNLALDGVPITAGQVVAATDLARLTFTPGPNDNGPGYAAFTFSVSDGVLFDTAPKSLTFDVNPVNDPPVALPNFAVVALPVPVISGNVLANDSDPDVGDVLVVSAVNGAALPGGTATVTDAQGTLVVHADGSFTYTANGADPVVAALTPGQTIEKTFSYQASDGNGGVTTSTLTISISGVNDPPTSADSSVTLAEDGSHAFADADFPFTDPDSGGSERAVRVDSLPAVGRLTFDGLPVAPGTVIPFADLGKLVYTPPPDANGPALTTFAFSVTDGNSFAAGQTLTLNVTPVNDAPIALGETGNTPEDTPLTFTTAALLANDTDVDGDTLTITAVSPASANGGTVSLVAGKVIYTPAANFNGTDTFTYTVDDGHGGTASATVSVTVTPVNDAPVSANATRTIDEDTVYRFTGAEFAFADPDAGDALVAVRIDSLPARGNLALDGVPITAGQVVAATDLARLTFTPGPNDNGPGYAAFTFSVSDGVLFDTAPKSLTFDVNPVNDPPVARDDIHGTNEDAVVPVTGNVLGGPGVSAQDVADVDADGDTLVVTGVRNATGTAAAPGATLSGAFGTLTLNTDGTYTYSVNNALPSLQALRPGQTASDQFTYAIADGNGGSSSATLTIAIAGVNDAPVAADRAIVTRFDRPVSGRLTGTDVENDPLTFSLQGIPANGAAVVNADGTFTYRPNPGFVGTDTFVYRVSDGAGGVVDRTVTVTVGAPTLDATVPVADVNPHPIGVPLPPAARDVVVTGLPAGGTLVDGQGRPLVVGRVLTPAEYAAVRYTASASSSGNLPGFTFTVNGPAGTPIEFVRVSFDVRLSEPQDFGRPAGFRDGNPRVPLAAFSQAVEPALFVLPAVSESIRQRGDLTERIVASRSIVRAGEIESSTLAEARATGPGVFVLPAIAEVEAELAVAGAASRTAPGPFATGATSLFNSFDAFADSTATTADTAAATSPDPDRSGATVTADAADAMAGSVTPVVARRAASAGAPSFMQQLRSAATDRRASPTTVTRSRHV